tara:strand:- start:11120 stop:13465 length:2346 start_codon:yes stop_codon:yes gene_type:complete
MGFIKINNRENFLISSVPELHPASAAYMTYWRLHKKRCIEGLWSLDKKGKTVNIDGEVDNKSLSEKNEWRWMPANLYFYVNFGTIEHNPDDEDADETAPKIKMRPHLRDFEWEFFYNWIEARGFSGFEDDEFISCDRRIPMYLEAIAKKKTKKALRIKRRMRKNCYLADGKTLKTYEPARTYLRKLYTAPLGIALFGNEAQNLFILGARGGGKSYLVGIGVLLHEFLFDGVKRYTEESRKNPPRAQICLGAALSSKSAEILEKFMIGHDNLKGEYGVGTKDYKPAPFKKTTSGTLAPNNVKNSYKHEYEVKEGGEWVTKGSGTSLKHVIYTTENPEAAAGGRYTVMGVEEIGLLGNILAVHGSNDACQMKDGTVKFGSSVYIGTGGNVEKIQEAEIIFRDPVGFNFLACEDEWEGTGKTGWFVPAYYMDGNYKDEQGNTLIEEAIESYEERREEKRKSKDSSALSAEMMNYPLKPSEMFLNAKGSMFPQAMIKAHLAEVQANPHRFGDLNYHVELDFDSQGEIQITNVASNALEIDWPIKDNKNRPGVIEIFEMPKRDSSSDVIRGRYIQGTDTYDDDESITTSLGSTWVLDTWTERLVAEYTGRRGSKEFYEITRKLNIFFRCDHNYEQNKKGLYTYYEQKNSTHWLCDTPESLKDVADITISKVGNKRKGTTASTPINAHGLRLILDWLLTPAYGKDNTEILNLHTIRSVGLLRELLNFNKNGNFDRVSALIMLMILKEEKVKYVERAQKAKVKSLADDPFFAQFGPVKNDMPTFNFNM